MKQCKKCGEVQEIEAFPIEKKGGKQYVSGKCRWCSNSERRARVKQRVSSPIRLEFQNCQIRQGEKIYLTAQLSATEVAELKEMGYGFIFK